MQELQRLLLTKRPKDLDVGSITPLTPYEAEQLNRQQLSSDPVIANIQKLGRGIKGFLSPETPLDYLSMATPIGKIAKGASKNINSIVDKYKDKGVELSVFENPSNKTIYLSKIKVDNKKQGQGTKVMDDLISYADETQQTITLTPSLDYGASSIKRLKDFYKRFDFVENKGKNKDFEFRDAMYRNPK
jgi:hypothetical protein